MENVVLPQASLFLGIIPALLLLWISLKGYEGYYKEKNIFLTFIVGIVLGFFAAVARIIIPIAALNVILFAIFEQLFKTIILNLRRFQQKKETAIYGLSLGLGFGSIFTPFLLTAVGSPVTEDVYIFSLIMIGSIGIILFHGASGSFIGYGIYANKLARYLIIAIAVQLPFNGIIFMTRWLFSTEYFAYLQLGLVVYGLTFYWYTTKKIMPRILSQNIRRKRRGKKFNS